MSDMNNEQQEQVSFDPSPNTEFIRENIKAKPINKKKLIRRTFMTALTAAVFGAVACVTFFLLEPVISEKLNKTEETTGPVVEMVSFAETPDNTPLPDEMLPEDMYANDTEMIEEALQGYAPDVTQSVQDIEKIINSMEVGIDHYQKMYSELRSLSDSVNHSVVTVTGVTTDDAVLANSYEYSAQVSGVIIADNGPALLILVKNNGIRESDNVQVTFWDGRSSNCEILGYDEVTGLMVLSVNKSHLISSTLVYAQPAILGTSRSVTLKGTPVVALGSPNGIADSMAYGMITSGKKQLNMTDADYMYMFTDILSTDMASGILINLRGNVIGIIDNSYESDPELEVVKAIGITELKPLIEKLSNSQSKAFLGVQGMDITYTMRESFDLPEGIYIKSIDMDSPAMAAGMQNGDILIAVNGGSINTYHDFMLWLAEIEPGSRNTLTVLRQSVDQYVKVNLDVTLGEVRYSDSDAMEE